MRDRDVFDRATGKPRMCAERCATCILNPAENRIKIGARRLREFIAEVRRAETYVICHSTLPGMSGEHIGPSICRGFYERFSTNVLRIYERLGGFTEVQLPEKEDDHA